MMSLAGVLPGILFWFPVLVLAAISALFWQHRIYRELPFFFLYILSAPTVGLLRYVTFRLNKSAYFYVYWIAELGLAVVFSLALYEVFLRRLFPRFHKVSLYRALFPAVAAAILLLTIIAVLQSSDRRTAFQVASRAFDFVRTAFLVFFMLLMLLMGRQWSRYDLGITLGFGIQAAAALVNAAVRSRLGHRSQFFDTAEAITFEVACVIWLITFLKPEHAHRLQPVETLDPLVLPQARKWESVLKDWLTPGKRML
ncbi:MAG TPA: hypothetical protein VFP59_00765 [Candidatus Angelobacter sp.]|nr:hypothetical protein [Candidatus Angelobacter sp.]